MSADIHENRLYVHQLKDLTPKAADIESTFIIRELKKTTPYPFTAEKIFDYFTLFYVSLNEKNHMARALELLPEVLIDIQELQKNQDPDYELINLQRATAMLTEIPQPLIANLKFAHEVADWQDQFTESFPALFNSIPHLSTKQERMICNQKLNDIFMHLLRETEMHFNYKDIIYEAHVNRARDLAEAMEKGFFFRVFLEEELKKVNFEQIKARIPQHKLKAADDIRKKVEEIKKGVVAAYDMNLRMLNWGLVVYSYIKWLNNP